MITYGMLNREEIEVYRGYLTQEAYDRRLEKSVFFYGASAEEELVAVAAFEAGTESELLCIAVSPDWQRKGIGSELVDRIGDLLFEQGCAALQVILSGTKEEQAGLAHFLWRCGFHWEDEVPVGIFTLEKAMENEVMKKAMAMKAVPAVQKLSEAEPILIKTFGKSLAAQGLYYGFETGEFEESCSSVYLENGEITGCVLIGKEKEELELRYVYVDEHCRDSVALLRMLAHSMSSAANTYPLETMVSAIAVNPAAEKILTKVIGENIVAEQMSRYVLPLSQI